MSVVNTLKAWLGWCPNASAGRAAGSRFPTSATATGGDGGAFRKEWFRVDSILKEEIMRSIAVWFASFMAIGLSMMAGYVYVPGFWPFILALVPTAIYVALMTRYRRREQLYDPTLPAIVSHMMGSRPTRDVEQAAPSRSVAKKAFDIMGVAILSLIYISASALYPGVRPLWLIVIAGATIAIGHILFDGRAAGATPVRIAVLYAVMLPLVAIHAYTLGSSIAPVVVAILLVGGVSCGVVIVRRMMKK